MNPQSHQQHIYMSAISSLIKEIMTLLLRERKTDRKRQTDSKRSLVCLALIKKALVMPSKLSLHFGQEVMNRKSEWTSLSHSFKPGHNIIRKKYSYCKRETITLALSQCNVSINPSSLCTSNRRSLFLFPAGLVRISSSWKRDPRL